MQLHDIPSAFSLLTRLPVPVDHARAGQRGAAAAWAFPLVGMVIGALAGGVAAALIWLGVPSGMAAATALAVLAIASGGMHEDGLADFADGIGGARDKAHALEIMKDSCIGAYGAIALGVALLARWSGITELSGWAIIGALVIVSATSRAGVVLAMHALPSARIGGLSDSAGRPDLTVTLIASGIALAFCLALTGPSGIVIFTLGYAGAAPVIWLAMRKLGGQTGDVLGAVQQSIEIATLAALLALA